MQHLRFLISVSVLLFLTLLPLDAQSRSNQIVQSDNHYTTKYDDKISSMEELSRQLQEQLDHMRSLYEQQQTYKAFSKILDLSPSTFETEVQLHSLSDFSHHEEDFISFSKLVAEPELRNKAKAYAVLAKAQTVLDEQLLNAKDIDAICDELRVAYPRVFNKHLKDAEEVYNQMMNYVYCVYQLEYLFKMIDEGESVPEDNSRLREVRPIKVLYNCFTKYNNEKGKRSEIRSIFHKYYPDLSF